MWTQCSSGAEALGGCACKSLAADGTVFKDVTEAVGRTGDVQRPELPPGVLGAIASRLRGTTGPPVRFG